MDARTWLESTPKPRQQREHGLRDNEDERPTFIDVFAGCGGLSLGLMAAGWKGLFAIDRDRHAHATLLANFPTDASAQFGFAWPEWLPRQTHDIEPFLKTYRSQLIAMRGTVDLIAGGPPCQGFSFAGRRKAGDPRNGLFRQYLELVELVQPSMVLLENVPGITIEFGKKAQKDKADKPFSEVIVEKLSEDYYVFWRVLAVHDFGVPQRRSRFILVGYKKSAFSDADISDPFDAAKAGCKAFLKEKGIAGKISVRQAISDLALARCSTGPCEDSEGFQQIVYCGKPRTSYQRLMNGGYAAPNSLRLANHQERTLERFEKIIAYCKKSSRLNVLLSPSEREALGFKKLCLRVLDPDRPSTTVTSLPDDVLHYAEARTLSVREVARIQSFPDWFQFKGKYTTGGHLRAKECPRYTQVANAVPPLLAEFLGGALKPSAHVSKVKGRRAATMPARKAKAARAA